MKYLIYLKNQFEKSFFKSLLLFLPVIGYSQNGVWGKLTTESGAAKDAGRTIGEDLSAVGLFIGLIFVIYSLAENKNNAKSYAIAWIAALIIYFLMFDLVK